MGKSFYLTDKISSLRDDSQSFTDLIVGAPTSYGLTAPIAASYKTLNDDFVAKYEVANAGTTRTKAAITARNDAMVLLKAKAAELAKIIEANTTVTNEQREELKLSVRATPAPAPAPGTPSALKTELLGDGSLQLKWKANNPSGLSGVTYQVWRRIGDIGEFTYLTASGEKKCIDSTIPKGTVQAQYQIRGLRPTAAGPWAQFIVNFAKDTSGVVSMNVTTQSPVKIAA